MKFNKTSLSAWLLATSALVAPVLAHAQTAPQESPPVDEEFVEEETITEVVVRGKNVPTTMRRTAEVTAILTGEDLQRTGDDSAAAALTRVTGLSLVEGRFIYVRGLGERYSSALLNGSPLPSPEPLQRVVPLDLFPASILARVSVQKTYSAEFPGEFGGGVVDLRTITTPSEPFFKFGISTGGNSETTFKDGYTHYGSDTDPIGFDDGTRSLSSELRQALQTGKRVDSSNFTAAELQSIGQSFTNAPLNLIQQSSGLPANFSFNVSGGSTYQVGGGELGVIGLLDFSNGWRTKNGVQETGVIDIDQLVPQSTFDYQTTENNVSLNGLFGLGYQHSGHALQWTNLFIRNTTKRTKVREGLDLLNSADPVRDENTGWYARQLAMTQLTGKHALSDRLTFDWRGAYAVTTRDVPYEKAIRYALDADDIWFHDGSRVQNSTSFSMLEDTVTSFGAALTWDFSLGEGRDGKLIGGVDHYDNERESESRLFRFLPNGVLPFNIQYSRVDFLFSDVNISPDRFTISERTGSAGAAAYDAGLKVSAAYAKVDVEIIPLVRVAAGVRFEDAKQDVTVVKLFTAEAEPTQVAPIEESYVLPSVTVTWNFKEDMQLRGGLSKTIGRPQFRELAPQVYLDPEQDRLFSGNPYLVDTEMTNFDARYEWYYDAGQYVTAGFFYKDMKNPVESSVIDQGASLLQTYLNAPKATLYGLEFDYKGLFDSPVEGAFFDDKRWLLVANYTWTDSKVEAKDGDVVYPSSAFGDPRPATDYIVDGSRLQGQSEHVVNVQFGWDDQEARSTATFLVTYVSERSSARGRPGETDYIQEPGTMLDFTYRKGFDAFGRDVTFGLEVRNLLGTEYQEYQEQNGRVDINKYDLGQSLSLSLSTEF